MVPFLSFGFAFLLSSALPSSAGKTGDAVEGGLDFIELVTNGYVTVAFAAIFLAITIYQGERILKNVDIIPASLTLLFGVLLLGISYILLLVNALMAISAAFFAAYYGIFDAANIFIVGAAGTTLRHALQQHSDVEAHLRLRFLLNRNWDIALSIVWAAAVVAEAVLASIGNRNLETGYDNNQDGYAKHIRLLDYGSRTAIILSAVIYLLASVKLCAGANYLRIQMRAAAAGSTLTSKHWIRTRRMAVYISPAILVRAFVDILYRVLLFTPFMSGFWKDQLSQDSSSQDNSSSYDNFQLGFIFPYAIAYIIALWAFYAPVEVIPEDAEEDAGSATTNLLESQTKQ